MHHTTPSSVCVVIAPTNYANIQYYFWKNCEFTRIIGVIYLKWLPCISSSPSST